MARQGHQRRTIRGTRGNIARRVLRGAAGLVPRLLQLGPRELRDQPAITLYNTHAYYLGNATTMVYTDTTASRAAREPVGQRRQRRRSALPSPNPELAVNGFAYITYNQSGDDADINDVLYSGSTTTSMYGVGASGTSYYARWAPRTTTRGPGWAPATSRWRSRSAGRLPPTRCRFLTDPVAAEAARCRASSGSGAAGATATTSPATARSTRRIRPDSAAHFNNMIALLGSETNANTGEIKNSAFYTPLAGTPESRQYFRTTAPAQTPIAQTCQRNFVVMATDGNPTGAHQRLSQYNPSDMAATRTTGAGSWTYGQAQRDVFAQLDGAALDHRRRAAATTSRPTSSAWATRSPTRARSPR